MSIKGRIRRLEAENAKTCKECRDTSLAIRVVYPDQEEPKGERCPGCGRALGVILRVVYDDERGG